MPDQKRGRVLYVFMANRDGLLEAARRREQSNYMFYGMTEFDSARYEVSHISRQASQKWISRLISPLEAAINRRLKMGFSLGFILEHRGPLRRAQAIISVADAVGLPIAALKYLGLLPTPLVYMLQGLPDRLEAWPPHSRTYRFFRALYGHFLRRVERVVVLGEGARQPAIDLFQLDPVRVSVVQFGVDPDFWAPSSDQGGDYILSVGSDMGRDYASLFAAIGDLPLRIITRQNLPRHGHNIRVESDFSDPELRTLYQEARFLVMPLKDVSQPTGQSATLQAMACGKAVILSNIRGLWQPSVMRHGENCILVPPGDPQALAAAIQELWHNPDLAAEIGARARQTVLEHYTSRHLAARLEALVDPLIQGALV